MKTFLFFGYRDWAINIFRDVSEACGDNWILVSKERSCTKEFIDNIKPDIIFFYGWSWIVPPEIVNNYTCLCLHPSPLPKYRGGSPIQNQIIAGEQFSAVTIFKMGDGLDDGDIVFQEAFGLTGGLDVVLAYIEELGFKGTLKIIDDYTNDYISGEKQIHEDATYCKRRTPDQSEIEWVDFTQHEAKHFVNMVEALQPPYPECFVRCRKGKLIIEKARYEL